MPYKLAPSILSADFTRLGEYIKTVERAGAHYLHFDVMDGHFVPNISFGVPVLRSIRPVSGLVFDVHLMISEPERYLDTFARAGADIINVHAEAARDLPSCLRQIRRLAKKAAVTVKPSTPVSEITRVADLIDLALIMSVEPGFGGQAFIPSALHKAEELAGFLLKRGLEAEIEMDGGIGLDNVRSALNAGVTVVVAGSAVFALTPEETADNVRAFLAVFDEK